MVYSDLPGRPSNGENQRRLALDVSVSQPAAAEAKLVLHDMDDRLEDAERWDATAGFGSFDMSCALPR